MVPISSVEARASGYHPDEVARIELQEEACAEATALIAEIERVFDGVPRPRITRSVARGYDDEWVLTEERVHELAAQDSEQRWQEVPDEAMEMCQEYFCFTDAEGLRFYLPAYMRYYLRQIPSVGWDAAYGAASCGEHLDLLTEEQRWCVEKFLDFCHRHEDTP